MTAPMRWWRAWRQRRRWHSRPWWPPSRRARLLGLVAACVLAGVLGTWLGSATPALPPGTRPLPDGVPYQARKPRVHTVDLVDLGGLPGVFRPDGVLAHTSRDRRAVAFTDLTTGEDVGSIGLAGPAGDLASGMDGRTAYATDPGGVLRTLDLDARTVTGSIPVGGRPGALAVAPDGRRVYVGDAVTGSVAVVDPAVSRVVDRWTVGHAVSDLALGADGTRLVVAQRAAGTVTVLDTGSGRTVGTAAVPPGRFSGQVGATAVAAGRTSAYVTTGAGVTVVDLGTGAASRPTWTPDPVLALALSADGRLLYLVTSELTDRSSTTTPVVTVDPVDGTVVGRTDLDIFQAAGSPALTPSPDGRRLVLAAADGYGQTHVLDLR